MGSLVLEHGKKANRGHAQLSAQLLLKWKVLSCVYVSLDHGSGGEIAERTHLAAERLLFQLQSKQHMMGV